MDLRHERTDLIRARGNCARHAPVLIDQYRARGRLHQVGLVHLAVVLQDHVVHAVLLALRAVVRHGPATYDRDGQLAGEVALPGGHLGHQRGAGTAAGVCEDQEQRALTRNQRLQRYDLRVQSGQ